MEKEFLPEPLNFNQLKKPILTKTLIPTANQGLTKENQINHTNLWPNQMEPFGSKKKSSLGMVP